MPYNTGETPEVGDRIFDLEGRLGAVTHVIMWGSGRTELVIKWDDGTTGIRYLTHEDFELVRRKDGEIVSHAR